MPLPVRLGWDRALQALVSPSGKQEGQVLPVRTVVKVLSHWGQWGGGRDSSGHRRGPGEAEHRAEGQERGQGQQARRLRGQMPTGRKGAQPRGCPGSAYRGRTLLPRVRPEGSEGSSGSGEAPTCVQAALPREPCLGLPRRDSHCEVSTTPASPATQME